MIIGAILVVGTCRVSTAIIKRFEHELLSINEGLEKAVRQRTKSLMKTRDAVIVGLAKLAESRDSDTGEHLERINLYSTKLAQAHAGQRRLDDPVVVESIGLASSLHDIGKVGVPDRVLLKAGKLDAEERSEIEKHPQVGEQCINEIETRLGEDGFLSLARDICAHHHERWDGTGYPYGISGERIPIAARLVAVADVYDALRSRRPYKEPLSHSAACKIIVDGMGTHFDPSVIQTFVEIHHEFEAISEQYLKPEMPVSSPLLNHTPALGSALAVPSID
ncbi:MAG TPA: metal-dependent phosphohydrolase [Planctomycetaceae bacterium]|nr:metal-dependent phosphohydrolase [Planctomycetaceae bacterium]